MSRYVLGVEVATGHLRAALVDAYGNVRGRAAAELDARAAPAALAELLDQLWLDAATGPAEIRYTALVIDLCREALAQKKGLARVAVIRLAAPAGTALPPLIDWPADLAAAVGGACFELSGGTDVTGRPIGPLPSDAEIAAAVGEINRRKLSAAAVCGISAPVYPQQEEAVGAALQEALGPRFPVLLSHRLGSLGLLERENATVLNAALMQRGDRPALELTGELQRLGVTGPVYVARNDGTLMALQRAALWPLLTARANLGHGLRGAAHLAGLRDCAVLLCTDAQTAVGLVHAGLPRQSQRTARLAGVRASIPLPAAVALPALPAAGEPPAGEVLDRLEQALDRMRGGPAPTPVVAAGPLAARMPGRLRGAHRVLHPVHAPYCVPVGAALAPVGGLADLLYPLERWTPGGARADAVRRAVAHAVAAGADPDTTEVARLDEGHLAYVPERILHLKVTVVGRPAVAAPASGPAICL